MENTKTLVADGAKVVADKVSFLKCSYSATGTVSALDSLLRIGPEAHGRANALVEVITKTQTVALD